MDFFHTKNTILSLVASSITFSKLDLTEIEDIHRSGEIVLGTKDIQNYVIKPIHRYQALEQYFSPELLSPSLKQLDMSINEVGKYLNISYHLDPINLSEQKEIFLEQGGKYNPLFVYKFPDTARLEWIEQKLTFLQKEIKDIFLDSRLFQLYDEKITELFCKLSLLKGYVEQDFSKIYKYQKRLYGGSKTKLLEIAERKMKQQHELPQKSQVLGRRVSQEEIIRKIQEKILMYGLPETQILVREDMTARISVTTGQFARINLKK